MRLTIIPLGDRAILVKLGERIDPALNDQVIALYERLATYAEVGITFCTPAFCSLGVGYNPDAISFDDLSALVQQQFELIQTVSDRQRRLVRIPVCYSSDFGLDLEQVAATTGLSCEQVVEIHSSKTYRAYMLGFLPGFAYLGSVDSRLQVDRKAQPRLKVPVGSVGLVGEQTGVYPCDAPGGWQIIGRTPISLHHPSEGDQRNQFLISPGDEIQFYPIDQTEYELLVQQNNATENQSNERLPPVAGEASVTLSFRNAGLRTALQDLGRSGHQHLGVPAGGVMDRFSATIANRLVGNVDDAALVEITLLGPAIEINGDCQIAITGANLSPKLDGRAVAMWETISVFGTQRLTFGPRLGGCRGYLAIAGELEVPSWLGSVSTSPPGADSATEYQSLKGRTLSVAANSSPLNKRIFPVKRRPVGLTETQTATVEHCLRISLGPEWDWFSKDQQAKFLDHRFEILPSSNSMGYRLSSFLDQLLELPAMISSAVVPGVIQVTPSGQCILLMRDAHTTGGYPRVGVVEFESLNQVAQLCLGDSIRFVVEKRTTLNSSQAF